MSATLGGRVAGIQVERRRSERVLAQLLPGIAGRHEPDHVRHQFRGSNDLLNVRVGSRRLMLKRGLEPWSAERFRTARAVARRISERSGIVTPVYLPVREVASEWAVLAWWRLEHPTLEEVWPTLGARARAGALRSLGELLARLHRIPMERWGPPCPDASGPGGAYLLMDLQGRLRRAVTGSWPEALPLVEEAVELASDPWTSDSEPCLAHNDAHLSNVICSVEGDEVRCIGLLDLEAAGGALPEADLAYVALVHSTPMAGDLGRGWLQQVLDGHGGAVHARRMRLFRLYHLLNIGIHAALAGDHERASHLACVGAGRV